MRRKFVLPLCDRKTKLREEMKELFRIGRKFVDGEKEYVRKEKEFKENYKLLSERKKRKKK